MSVPTRVRLRASWDARTGPSHCDSLGRIPRARGAPLAGGTSGRPRWGRRAANPKAAVGGRHACGCVAGGLRVRALN